jgi:hypothetical protein
MTRFLRRVLFIPAVLVDLWFVTPILGAPER